MTLPAALAHIEYVSSGGVGPFSFPFKISSGSELEVRENGDVATENFAYSVTGVGNDDGGSITFFSTVAPGIVVSLRRVTLFEQLLKLLPNGGLPASALEGRLDLIVKMIQQLEEELSRRPGFAVGAAELLRYMLIPHPGAGKLIGFNQDGDGLTLYDPSILTVTPSATTGETHTKGSVEVDANGHAGEYILTAAAFLPSNARIKSVSCYVSTTFSNASGLTGLDIGGIGISDRWGRAISRLITTAFSGLYPGSEEPVTSAAEDVTITALGGPFTNAGKIILTYHAVTYVSATAVP